MLKLKKNLVIIVQIKSAEIVSNSDSERIKIRDDK